MTAKKLYLVAPTGTHAEQDTTLCYIEKYCKVTEITPSELDILQDILKDTIWLVEGTWADKSVSELKALHKKLEGL